MPEKLVAKSCGVFVMRRKGSGAEFLLMRHTDRLDFPKGHIEGDESELECALRELKEETRIRPRQVRLDPKFRYENTYTARYKRFGHKPVTKTLVLFLGWVDEDAEAKVSEHAGYEWMTWAPPHRIQEQAIDPLLQFVDEHFRKSGGLHSAAAAAES